MALRPAPGEGWGLAARRHEWLSCAVGAGEDFTVHHNAAADAGAQGDQNHAAIAPAAALPALAQGGYIGVIARFDRKRQKLG